ncbi:hypothetical protein [Paraburkholderia tropica]|uniref:hypothetical protein n=1 Tax=Paraburkholderia tropica TaxID=92647 RepID=UPI001619638C|nr:hypothetical protein [Paraburkholderia tropica]MBB3001695.1 hypothetical protein [Paraburkholderia tropica]MBB6321109.1 hypothetical protein [Paraburkholderia tropica]
MLKFSIYLPIRAGMNTTIAHAQAGSIIRTATKLFDLVVESRQIDARSPEGIELYSEIVYGALWRAAPRATMQELLDLFDEPVSAVA